MKNETYIFNNDLLNNYFTNLTNSFFKILPMREDNEDTLTVYMESLQREIEGCKNVFKLTHNDGNFVRIISILQYLIDNPNESQKIYKREVFKAIDICNKLKQKYGDHDGHMETI
jgi:hypothetical protein